MKIQLSELKRIIQEELELQEAEQFGTITPRPYSTLPPASLGMYLDSLADGPMIAKKDIIKVLVYTEDRNLVDAVKKAIHNFTSLRQ